MGAYSRGISGTTKGGVMIMGFRAERHAARRMRVAKALAQAGFLVLLFWASEAAALPDLVIRNASCQWAEPNGPFFIRAKVRNLGEDSTTSTLLYLHTPGQNPLSTGSATDSEAVDGLDAGETTDEISFRLSHTRASLGSYILNVDQANRVHESNEGNNEFALDCTSPWDFTISAVCTGNNGRTVEAVVHKGTNNIPRVNNIKVELMLITTAEGQAESSSSPVNHTQKNVTTPIRGTDTRDFQWRNMRDGTYRAVVDANKSLPETDEGNNESEDVTVPCTKSTESADKGKNIFRGIGIGIGVGVGVGTGSGTGTDRDD